MIKKILGKIHPNIDVEVKPPDIIIYRNGRVYLTRYLVSKEVNYGLKESSADKIIDIVERYGVVLERIPVGSEIKIIKLKSDPEKILAKITNEMLNLKAIIETVEEEHVKRKTLTRLRILEKLYDTIINGKPITRIILVVKIHASSTRYEDAVREASNTAFIIKSMIYNMLGINLVEADKKMLKRILSYEIGLEDTLEGKGVIIETNRLAQILPAPPRKKPEYENSGESIPLGYDIETGWPVLLPLDILNKHVLIIGPTGRGKTTLLAAIMESLISLDSALVSAVDFKGDLVGMVPRSLIDVVKPDDIPFNILLNPRYIGDVEWALMVADVVSSILGLDESILLEILGKYRGKVLTGSEIIEDPKLGVLSPIINLMTDKPRYDKLLRYLNINTLFDLSGYGTVYQNIYGGLLIEIFREAVVKEKKHSGKLHVLMIDEAWRITKLRGLLEIVKEGRSRNIGVVLAVQNPSDTPQEIIENTHFIAIFGSPNEEYQKQASKILGLPKNTVSKLKYLGVGEAILLNALDPHPVIVKINKPATINVRGG